MDNLNILSFKGAPTDHLKAVETQDFASLPKPLKGVESLRLATSFLKNTNLVLLLFVNLCAFVRNITILAGELQIF